MTATKTRDADATKEEILKAAELVFAEKGFAGATLREISKASSASGPLIVFHFKDKHGVYEAVKAAIIRRFFAVWDNTFAPKESVHSFIEHILRAMFRFYQDNPTMIRLARWGRLEGDIEPWPGEEEWHHACWDRIRESQERGEIRNDLTPLHISIFICGAVHIWWEYHDHFLEHAAEHKRNNLDADEFYFRQCLSFVLQGLSNLDALKAKKPSSQRITKGKQNAKRAAKPRI